MRRYPLDALAAAAGMSEAALGRAVGLSGSTLKKAREWGLVADAADRYAIRAGLHPAEVWPTWLDDHLQDEDAAAAERLERRRAAGRRYAAKRRQDPEFRARQAAYLRAYRSSERARKAARNYREGYYAANRERELARQAAYDATVRKARRAAARSQAPDDGVAA